MADQTVELEIQNLPNNETEAGGSRVSLICHRGWTLGKKIAIVGVAVSSAPIVLPPLVLFSALCFVLSVPFGLALAGYACTGKLMRSLLPVREDFKYDETPIQEEVGEVTGDGKPLSGNDKENGDVVMELEKHNEGEIKREIRKDKEKEEEVEKTEGDRHLVEEQQEEKAREFNEDDKEKGGDVGEIGEDKEEVTGREGNVREITLTGREKEESLGSIGKDSGVEGSSEHVKTEEEKADDAGEIGERGLEVGRECGKAQMVGIIDGNEEENVVPEICTPEIEEVSGYKKPLSDADGEGAFAQPSAQIVQQADPDASQLSSEQEFATVERTLDVNGTREENPAEHPDISIKPTTIVPTEMEIMKPAEEARAHPSVT